MKFCCLQALSKIKIGISIKINLGYFFDDSQKFILSCVMQATWNKYLHANIVYCVQYLEKEAKVLKFV